MRHARPDDLDRIETLLDELRKVDGLKEKTRGSFYRGAKGFLHFHEHQGDIVVDVRLAGPNAEFERRVVTTRAAQRALVSDVKRTVRSAVAG